jgi:hypothetical protein
MTNPGSQPQDTEGVQKPPPFSRQLATLYKIWTLDCVTHIGHAVSIDFSNRPNLYSGINLETANQLTEMQSEYGFSRNFANDAIRLMLMKPIFGESDGHGSGNDGSGFQAARMPVLAAAAGFALNAQPLAFQMHRERFRNEAFSFVSFMTELEGASFSQTEVRMRSVFNTAASIIRDSDVASKFGITDPIDASWPLEFPVDPTGARLIEYITTQLLGMPYGIITLNQFVHMQRMAQKGFDSISRILETNLDEINVTDDAINELIREFYAWGSELRLVGGATPQMNGASPGISGATPATFASM